MVNTHPVGFGKEKKSYKRKCKREDAKIAVGESILHARVLATGLAVGRLFKGEWMNKHEEELVAENKKLKEELKEAKKVINVQNAVAEENFDLHEKVRKLEVENEKLRCKTI